MRLDKYLANMDVGSRKEVKQLIKKKRVAVNGKTEVSDKFQVNENEDCVTLDEEEIIYQKYFYYILNKPADVISATVDDFELTVLDIFSDQDFRSDLFPVGRLDKDTKGLLVITNDGALSHRLLSPKKHVEKEYIAEVKGVMTTRDIERFAAGLKIDGDELCFPAELTIEQVDEENEESTIRLVLYEGKYHQVKRMVHAVGKEVIHLKRTRMGALYLDDQLETGDYRELTEEEIKLLENK
ncbi:MAG: rRNA pseudouridine synthase [Tetragenococcus halophilus]|uniref:Pseudouridine synthase n=1 Tax=Tetragenococcus halophilus TaxID=51669 RepID=A0AB35HQU4_TETHA|nr:pseudouridine synthase [Tetragenococcus halophilus]MCO7025926.1 rRNA pseudouridine synthase [Tetragenococcus halophilus]MCO8289210.1 rRNA pseudouridine synthase [Tetragenococcus halophilus]MCO8293341.1 rRNA pseudouridine synthase [Tetragenococcus halophilus]MCO8296565.1 rRNA pseudouridine synthase [Tetragenococcus halophilus]MCO8298606.1 rRNA pseudouridine synthase [Tetragenococcus halophilus]